MTYRYSVISLMMTAVIGLAAWFTFASYYQKNGTTNSQTSLPDAYMEDVVAVIMDKQGKPTMKIMTPRLVHYTEEDKTEFTSPQLTLYRKSPKPWFVTANYAQATQGTENINFWDNVVIHHAADENNPATMIKTPTLAVHPDKQIAQTNDVIMLIQSNLVVKATGMYADMNTGDIKLLSQARGEYVPSP